MNRQTAKWLLDTQRACEEIEQFVSGQDPDSFRSDRMRQLAVHKLLEIIGEALNQLSKADSTTAASISSLRRIVDMRNRITHGYDSVDYSIIWMVAEQEIPRLHLTVRHLLAETSSANQTDFPPSN